MKIILKCENCGSVNVKRKRITPEQSVTIPMKDYPGRAYRYHKSYTEIIEWQVVCQQCATRHTYTVRKIFDATNVGHTEEGP